MMTAQSQPDKPATSPFTAAAAALLEAGYHPIPVRPRDKAPGHFASGRWGLMEDWTKHRDSTPTAFLMRLWSQWPNANVGIVLGTRVGSYQVGCIDFDTDDADMLDELRRQIPPSPMNKRGAKGFTAFYLIAPDQRTRRYTIGGKVVLEILTGNATRQTVMPPSVHPSGAVYQYQGHGEIVPADKLPVLSPEHIEKLEDTLQAMGWREQAPHKPREPDGDSGDIWRETNDAALGNPEAWFWELGLPKSKRTGQGFEGVPFWRASNSGRPIEQRKPNLKVHRTGIKDMGTDQGYTALDLVMAATNWDFDTAFAWLRGKLGLDGDAIVLKDKPRLIECEDGSLADPETGEILQPPPQPVTIRDVAPVAVAADGSMPDHLTHCPGLLGELIDWITDTARRPDRVLALGAAITVLGTLIGRRVAGPTRSATHLFVLTLAPTGAGKDHPLKSTITLLKAAGAHGHVGPDDLISMTAVIKLLTRMPLSLCAMDEFGGFLKRINHKRASGFEQGVTKVLRTVWGTSFRTMMTPEWAGQATQEIVAPAMSICGASTPDEFYGALEGGDIINGVLNRFLVLSTTRRMPDRDPVRKPDLVPAELAQQLKALYAKDGELSLAFRSDCRHEVRPEEIGWSQPCAEAFAAFQRDIEQIGDNNKVLAPFLARTAEIAIRLATIRAAGRNTLKPRVELDDWEWGKELAMWSARAMARDAGDYISETETQGHANRIMRIVRDHGGRIRHRDLSRAMGQRLKSRDLQEVIKGLVEAGELDRQESTPARGGPMTVWYSLPVNEAESGGLDKKSDT